MSGSHESRAAEEHAAMDQHRDKPERSPVAKEAGASTVEVKKTGSSAADCAEKPKSSASDSAEKPKSSAADSAEKPKSSASDSAEKPKSSAADSAEKPKSSASDSAEKPKSSASDSAEKPKSSASDSAEKPKSSAADSAEKPKSSAADSAEKPKSSAADSAEKPESSASASASGSTTCLRYREIQGDLFQCPDTSSMAHCVSKDLQMGKGIATYFKANFGRVNELKRQGKTVGECAILEFPQRYIYYLITKKIYSHKPTYADLEASLVKMKEHCQSHGVKQLSMPQIACGLDRLAWNRVSDMIKKVFADVDISITIYFHAKPGGARGRGKPSTRVY